MSMEAAGLEAITETFKSAADDLLKDVGQIVSKGALNIKQQIQKDFRSSPSFGGAVAPNVRYNRHVTANSVEAEIAPFLDSEGRQSLVGIALYGGSRGGGGTVVDPIIALEAEAPNFEEALSKLAGVILDG